jgi:WLM domain
MVFLIVIILLFMLYKFRYLFQTEHVKSNVNFVTYRVANQPDKQDASDTVARLDQFAKEFIKNMKSRYSAAGRDPLGYELVANLEKRYKGGSTISENAPNNSDTSYTLNKGDYIVMCLREKKPPYKLHDIETLKFVFLHELAHVAMTMTDSEHSMNFWKQFKFLLEEAHNQGLYVPVDYEKFPTNYCGTEIKYNPIHAKELSYDAYQKAYGSGTIFS